MYILIQINKTFKNATNFATPAATSTWPLAFGGPLLLSIYNENE